VRPRLEKELERACVGEEDGWVRFEIAGSLFSLDRMKGGKLLLAVMGDDETPVFLKERAVELMREATETNFGYTAEASMDDNRDALKKWSDLLENDIPSHDALQRRP